MENLKELSLNLLELVITKDPNAVKEIETACRQSNFELSTKFQFDFYRKLDWTRRRLEGWIEFCDCWYINEYFEYCTTEGVNKLVFDKILENIKRGHCPHILGQSNENRASSSVSLIHATAAVNNKVVAKYLLNKDRLQRYLSTGTAKFPPDVVSFIKDSSDVLKTFSPKGLNQEDRCRAFMGQRMKFATRGNSGAVTMVKRIDSWSMNNPFLLCFFLKIKPSRQTIRKIIRYLNYCDLTNILRYVVQVHDRKTAATLLSSFSLCVSNIAPEVALECALWNKPEALSILVKKGTDLEEFSSNYGLLTICNFLGHHECASTLLELYMAKSQRRRDCQDKVFEASVDSPCPEDTCPISSVSPFTNLLTLCDKYKCVYNCESLDSLFSKLSLSGCDINQQDEYGMTPLHTALETISDKHRLITALDTLCRHGANGNIKDMNGRSALYVTLTPYNSPLGLDNSYPVPSFMPLRAMKLLLYHNSVPSSTPHAIVHAITRDRMNTFIKYADDETVNIILNAQYDAKNKLITAKCVRDKFLALSFVAILLELGFSIKKSVIPYVSKLPKVLEQYLLSCLSRPLSLESRCRNVIRAAYPGPKLQKLLDNVHIPAAIADIILFKEYLLRTEIISNSGICFYCLALAMLKK